MSPETHPTLDVYLHGHLAGRLSRLENARLQFRYDAEWAEVDRIPLSHSLPVRREPFDDEEARPFFAGLLPEGDFRRAVARAFHVSAGNPFSLLDAIGGECAGAVSLVAPGQTPPSPGPVRWLSGTDELRSLVEEMPEHPLHLVDEDEGLRLSLAGAQDKLPVMFSGGRIGITHGDPPSTHIIKLPPRRFDWLAENEAFCLDLGRAAGLDVASAQVRYLDGVFADEPASSRYLLVERYDRTVVDGDRRRLHQEDFCQALGYVPEEKYEADGGPGIGECARLLHEVSAAPARDLLALADAVFFNFVIGNRDAHSKNFSILLEGDPAPRLAPLYDLVSTVAYDRLDAKLPMKVGGEKRPDYVRGRHIDRMADALEVSRPGLRRRALEVCERIEGGVEAVGAELAAEFRESAVYGRIGQQIQVGLDQLRQACAESAGG